MDNTNGMNEMISNEIGKCVKSIENDQLAFMVVDIDGKTRQSLKQEVYDKVHKMFENSLKEYLGRLDKDMPGYDMICKAVKDDQDSKMAKMINQFNIQIDGLIKE